MYMNSLWKYQTTDIKSKRIQPGLHRDVIVIGAGMAGLLTAYYLQKNGLKVLILEAGTIASGQTESTTAKITSQHDLKYNKLINTVGIKKAQMYASANEKAIEEYEKLIKENKIDCDFQRVPAYLYTMEDNKHMINETKAAVRLGMDAFYTKETELPFDVKGTVCFRNQAQFSPLKFVKSLTKDIEILEHIKVKKIKKNEIITDNGIFEADKIVVATHYPIINFPGMYFLRQHQERSYVIALRNCPEIKGMYYGVDKNGLSMRQAGEYLLLGGGSHRTGWSHKGGSYCFLRKEAEKYFPNAKEVTRWAAQDCMPHDGIPFIGKYSVFTPNLYVATGFQKWGMTTSMVAAMILSDEICGRKNPYSKVFSPQRVNLVAAFKDFCIDTGVSLAGLFSGWSGDKEYRCPHLGCRLEWNDEEQSYDCPCHGSRFEENGRLLDNPSIKVKSCRGKK